MVINTNGVKEKVIITCKIHGDFYQLPTSHYKTGCYTCGIETSKEKQRKLPKQEMVSQQTLKERSLC